MDQAAAISELEDRTVFLEWSKYRTMRKRSLDRAELLIESLGFKEKTRTIPKVGVVGSKGKGTAAIYAAATLSTAGLRVGSVMSPGILSNRDRIRINGEAISVDDYRAILERVEIVLQKLPPVADDSGYLSPTGIFTIFGIEYLLNNQCDVLVLEAGMGGSSDELSLFTLDVLAITKIFGEHLEELGPTVADVAHNKVGAAGRATKQIVSIEQESEITEIIEAHAQDVPCEVSFVNDESDSGYDALPPGYGRMNALVGIEAAMALLASIHISVPSLTALQQTLATVQYPGRMFFPAQAKSLAGARVMIDAAINRDGLVAALDCYKKRYGSAPKTIVLSVPYTKDIQGMIDEISMLDSDSVFVKLNRINLDYDGGLPNWDGKIINESELGDIVRTDDTLFIGTVSFVASVLNLMNVSADRVYKAHSD